MKDSPPPQPKRTHQNLTYLAQEYAGEGVVFVASGQDAEVALLQGYGVSEPIVRGALHDFREDQLAPENGLPDRWKSKQYYEKLTFCAIYAIINVRKTVYALERIMMKFVLVVLAVVSLSTAAVAHHADGHPGKGSGGNGDGAGDGPGACVGGVYKGPPGGTC